MRKLSFLLSLPTKENDLQHQQALDAESAAQRLGVDLRITESHNDSIAQSEKLLSIIQSSGPHPDAIIVEPAGITAVPQVARAAVLSGIGWVLLDREVDYILELRAINFTLSISRYQ